MWTYVQISGRLYRDGVYQWTGYSGHGLGRNNPAWEFVPKIGPIPRGVYDILSPENWHVHLGPYALPLILKSRNFVNGRSGFFLHGDDAEHDASEGCVIKSPKSLRQLVWNSGDHELTVV
jgi:hypothetical protein